MAKNMEAYSIVETLIALLLLSLTIFFAFETIFYIEKPFMPLHKKREERKVEAEYYKSLIEQVPLNTKMVTSSSEEQLCEKARILKLNLSTGGKWIYIGK